MNYTELHLHDHYSALDGLNTPDEYMKRAKEIGMTHLAQTNHGTGAGWRDHQTAAKNNGIVPILGLEAYISETDRFDKRAKASRKDGTQVYNHIILLAQNEAGLGNLMKLNEIAWAEGFYHKPRIDFEVLGEYADDLIILSGCLNSIICKSLEAGDDQKAFATAKRLNDIAPGRFYIELQGHNPALINHGLLWIADSLGIPVVATSDCHYAKKEDLWIEEAMLILSTNPKPNKDFDYSKSQKMDMLERFNYLYPDRTMSFEKFELFLHRKEEHMSVFQRQMIDRTDLYRNTMEIANSIGEYPFHQGVDLLPKPKNADPDVMLEEQAWAGLKKRGLFGNPEYKARLREELEIIKSKNFSTYFIIVADVIQWAKDQGIMMGPGRGSAAGSLLCYALNITDVDPIKYGLLFFRFIDPERDDYPDVDFDSADKRRGEIKEYLRRKYGHVASIATFTFFRDKGVIKDAARVFRVPFSEVNRALKAVEAPPALDYFDVFVASPQGKEFNDKYPEVIKLASELRGRIRGGGMHAAGVVLGNKPLSDYMPIETATNTADKNAPRIPLIAADMNQVAEIGGIKLDALGLKTLSVMEDALVMIEDRYGKRIDLLSLPLDDAGVFQMLSDGHTKGVFQCEATPYTNLLIKMQVSSFDDLSVSNALIRPGAMNVFGDSYLARKAGKEFSEPIHPDLDKYLEDTYFLPIYQEQSMRLVSDLAGLGMSMANKVRKITAKKQDVTLLAEYKDLFIDGAEPKIGRGKAEWLWDSIEETASYAFNKSHSVAYSMLSYWTAWLKYHYPREFMVAILNNEGDKDAMTDYLIECKRLGIRVMLPHVNRSGVHFQIEGGDAIRMGLSNVKFLSDITAARVLERAPYKSYTEFYEYVMEKGNGLTSRVLQGLNAIGGASFDDNPKTGNERDNFYEFLRIPAFNTGAIPPRIRAQFTELTDYVETGCFIVSGMVKNIKRGTGWARAEIVDETGTAGIFTDENTLIEPGNLYVFLVSDNRIARFALIQDVVEFAGKNSFIDYLYAKDFADVPPPMVKVISWKTVVTKAGKKMARAVVADENKTLKSVLIFPQDFVKAYNKLKEGAVVDIEYGRLKDGTEIFRNAS
jgi:DNA polymerase-3 subunit alpha